MVVEALACIGFSDLRDYVEWGPEGATIKPVTRLAARQAAAARRVSERRHGQNRIVRVTLYDKVRAL
jgi:hypothetical protein